MDKIQKIKAEIYSLQDMTMDADGNFNSSYDNGRYDALCILDAFIDSILKESTSADLKEYAESVSNYLTRKMPDNEVRKAMVSVIKDSIGIGSDWQKENLLKHSEPAEIGYWNQRGLSIRLDKDLEDLGFGEDTKVKVLILKEDEA